MGDYRIGLVGCAGLGKTAIARRLGEVLGIPAILSKDITRPVLDRYGFQYGTGQFVELFLSHKDIEYEIVGKRMEAEAEKPSFVTDRTTVECFCYGFFNLPSYSEEEFAVLEDVCRTNALKYTHLFHLPFASGWFDSNGLRTMNHSFQWLIDNTIRGIERKWGLPVTEIPEAYADADKAVEYIMGKLKH